MECMNPPYALGWSNGKADLKTKLSSCLYEGRGAVPNGRCADLYTRLMEYMNPPYALHVGHERALRKSIHTAKSVNDGNTDGVYDPFICSPSGSYCQCKGRLEDEVILLPLYGRNGAVFQTGAAQTLSQVNNGE